MGYILCAIGNFNLRFQAFLEKMKSKDRTAGTSQAATDSLPKETATAANKDRWVHLVRQVDQDRLGCAALLDLKSSICFRILKIIS